MTTFLGRSGGGRGRPTILHCSTPGSEGTCLLKANRISWVQLFIAEECALGDHLALPGRHSSYLQRFVREVACQLVSISSVPTADCKV